MHIIPRVPSSKIDDYDILVRKGLKLLKYIVPERQIEAPKCPQKHLRMHKAKSAQAVCLKQGQQ